MDKIKNAISTIQNYADITDLQGLIGTEGIGAIQAITNLAEDVIRIGGVVENRCGENPCSSCRANDVGCQDSCIDYQDFLFDIGFNECHDQFTKAMAGRMQGLEDFIHDNCFNEIQPDCEEDIAQAIRNHLLKEDI